MRPGWSVRQTATSAAQYLSYRQAHKPQMLSIHDRSRKHIARFKRDRHDYAKKPMRTGGRPKGARISIQPREGLDGPRPARFSCGQLVPRLVSQPLGIGVFDGFENLAGVATTLYRPYVTPLLLRVIAVRADFRGWVVVEHPGLPSHPRVTFTSLMPCTMYFPGKEPQCGTQFYG